MREEWVVLVDERNRELGVATKRAVHHAATPLHRAFSLFLLDNEDVEVEYAIAAGGGRLSDEKGRTDRKGESRNTYTAGRSPGRVSIEITVRTTVPTAEEIAKARDLALAVTDYRFF